MEAVKARLVQSGKYTGLAGGKHSEGEAAIVADLRGHAGTRQAQGGVPPA